jgi:threonine/homoserine/homoserine lactone efflux protein
VQSLDSGGLLTFAAIWLAAAAAPGGNTAFTLAVSSRHGFLAGVSGVLGLVVALALYVALVALGLDLVIARSLFLFELLRWIGVAYLFALAYRYWTAGPGQAGDAAFEAVPKGRVFRQAAVICATNPKVAFAFAVLFPQAMDLGRPSTPQLLALGATALGVSAAVHLAYSALGASLGQALGSARKSRWPKRFFALFFACAGLALAVTKLGRAG